MNGQEAAISGGAVMGGVIGVVIMLAIFGVMLASMWKVFTKAGEPGWASLVPIYNLITMLKIAGKPAWWLVLMCVPLVNFYAMYVMGTGIAKAFGKGTGFGLGIVFLGPIFIPMLAFGDARYVGATARVEPPVLVAA